MKRRESCQLAVFVIAIETLVPFRWLMKEVTFSSDDSEYRNEKYSLEYFSRWVRSAHVLSQIYSKNIRLGIFSNIFYSEV